MIKSQMNRLTLIRRLLGLLLISTLFVGCGNLKGMISRTSPATLSFSPKILVLGETPVGVTRSPTVSWTESTTLDREISHYEARIYRAHDNTPVTDWFTISSGDFASGITLAKHIDYYFKLRAIDSDGNSGGEAQSSDWRTQVPTITLSDRTVDKFGVASITGALDTASSDDIHIDYSTADGTAVAGSDYKAVSLGSVVVPAGATSFTVPVTIFYDPLEGADKTLKAQTYQNDRAEFANLEALITIQGKASQEVFTQIVSSRVSNCALTTTGGVKCWGSSGSGEIGDNAGTARGALTPVMGLSSGVQRITAGLFGHLCALLTTGGVKCWGYGINGQLGYGDTFSLYSPTDVSGLSSGAVDITAGQMHTCALMNTGKIRCWGANNNGQFGSGSTSGTAALTPVEIDIGAGATQLAAGQQHTCALVSGGVKCWGENSDRRLGDGTNVDRPAPVTVIAAGSGVTSIAAGRAHTCALFASGELRCWGLGTLGQIGDGGGANRSTPVSITSLGTNVSAIGVGTDHTCAVLTGGNLRCWGANSNMQVNASTTTNVLSPTPVAGLSESVSAVSGGDGHTCATLVSGGVKCWGVRTDGVLGEGRVRDTMPFPYDILDYDSGVRDVSLFTHSACVLRTNGSVECWGTNLSGEVGNGTTDPQLTPLTVTGLSSGVTAISGSVEALDVHICAIVNGAAKCWGHNGFGKLGDNSNTSSPTPVDVEDLSSGVTSIAAGKDHSCAVVSGAAKCWGRNNFGQLGDSSNDGSHVPVQVTGLTSDVKQVSSSVSHACAVTNSGAAKCWGLNTSGQLGNNSTLSSNEPVDVVGLSSGVRMISAGESFTCALMETGGVKCWGSNSLGRLGNGGVFNSPVPVNVAGLSSGVREISSRGYSHSCALLETGTVKCWGSNSTGKLGSGALDTHTTPVDVVGLDSGIAKIQTSLLHSCAITFDGVLKCFGRSSTPIIGITEPIRAGPTAVQDP